MEILKPELIWVERRCYRINPSTGFSNLDTNKDLQDEDVSSVPYTCGGVNDDEPCDADIQEIDGQFKISVPVPSDFFSYIIGSKGATKKRIETETKTRISIPRQGNEGDIIIAGSDRRGVVSAKTRIDVLVSNVRQRTLFTHFVSVPFNSNPVRSGFLDFKDDVLRQCGECRGIDETIFQNPSKLHLTLGTLVLLNEQERQKAASLLKECETEFINAILKDKPLEVKVKGIEYMNDDPAEVDVLYAKVKKSKGFDKLLQITDLLVEKFIGSSLMQQEFERVKLHLTVMNTHFRKNASDPFVSHRKQDKALRETFDAREVLKLFGDYKFGTLKIATIEVSQLHSKAKVNDGYYGRTTHIQLPV